MTFRTREEWLIAAVDALNHEVFGEHEVKMPQVRVSVGFPGGHGKKTGVVGQCWATGATEDGRPAIFIHPTLSDRVEILAVLSHEMIHAWNDCADGHRGAFAKMFRLVGLVGKTTMSEPGEELERKLKGIIKVLGAYPHSAMKKGHQGPQKKQKTRMLKVVCMDEECGVSIRMTRKWLDEVGAPTCACGSEMDEC
jgi:hypothetical protein